MNRTHIARISSELSLRPNQVEATAELIEGGATVPFVARYRKEATGSLDEVAITAIRDRLSQLKELDDRRESILKSLEERELLTEDLKEQIASAETITILEDIYLPYRPKRRTRATIARGKGLEPLAELILAQERTLEPADEAEAFVDQSKGVESAEDALSGARDIIAEWVNEDQTARGRIRRLFWRQGTFHTEVVKGKEDEGRTYQDYFDWSEPVAKAPSHRILAMRRGAREGFLKLQVDVPEEQALRTLDDLFVKGQSACSMQVKEAAHDGYKRLLSPSIETEILAATKERADSEAIRVFADNLRELLLAPPLGRKNVLAIDPGFRTGCKVVCLDRQGQLKCSDVVYPHQGDRMAASGAVKIKSLCEQYDIEAIAIGNGTASRETEAFVRGIGVDRDIPVVMVRTNMAFK